jgi:uncharacterized membrane protein YhaH (DUF805 family)
MTQETENVLQRSLDAVDRHRRRLFWLLAIVAVSVGWEFYRLGNMRTTGNLPGMIFAAVLAVSFWTLSLTVMLVFQITVATKRILRAIELASRTGK